MTPKPKPSSFSRLLVASASVGLAVALVAMVVKQIHKYNEHTVGEVEREINKNTSFNRVTLTTFCIPLNQDS